MYTNNPLCGGMPIVTNSNKLRTYSTARYCTDREVLECVTTRRTGMEGRRPIMAKVFHGRVVVPGSVRAEAIVSHGGLNTLASFQKALMFGDKRATCSDQNNPDLYGKPMAGRALCLPQTIGSTTGGMVLFCATKMGRQPACLLFSKPIDSLAAAGAILSGVWTDTPMPTVDNLGDEFLEAVATGDTVTVEEDGTVTVS